MEEVRRPAAQFVDAFDAGGIEALKIVAPWGNHDLSGSVAMVTGGGRGIGRLVAEALASAGAAVAVTARTEDQLAETVAAITSKGGTAIALPGDVSDPDSVSEAVHQVGRRLGPVDLLINNAGISGPVGPVWEVDAGEWWRTFGINLQGVFLFAHAVLPGMVDRRAGYLPRNNGRVDGSTKCCSPHSAGSRGSACRSHQRDSAHDHARRVRP